MVAVTSPECIWLNSVGLWNEGCATKALITACCDTYDKNWGVEVGTPNSPGFDVPVTPPTTGEGAVGDSTKAPTAEPMGPGTLPDVRFPAHLPGMKREPVP